MPAAFGHVVNTSMVYQRLLNRIFHHKLLTLEGQSKKDFEKIFGLFSGSEAIVHVREETKVSQELNNILAEFWMSLCLQGYKS